MSNEMGNQNTSGLQVSEQETEEVTKVLAGFLSDSSMSTEKPDLKPIVEMDKSNSSGENEEEEESEKSVSTDTVLDQSQSTDSREHEDFGQNDEPADSSVVSNEEQTDSAQNNESLVQKAYEGREEENDEAGDTSNVSPKALADLSNVHGLTYSAHCSPYHHHDSEEHEAEEKLDVDEYGGYMEVLHVEKTHLAENEPLEITKETKEEEAKILAQESVEKGSESEFLVIDSHENNIEELSGEDINENNIEELSGEDISTRGEVVAKNSEVVEGASDQVGDRKCEVDAVCNDFGPLQLENCMTNESIHTVYLDAIDLEINKLAMEDDGNEVNEVSNKSLEEESRMDDIDTDSFEIQLNPCEEAVFEITIQSAYDPNLISEKQREDDLDGEIEDKPEQVVENETERLEKITKLENTATMEMEKMTEYFNDENGGETDGQRKLEGVVIEIIPTEVATPDWFQYLKEFEKESITISLLSELQDSVTPTEQEVMITQNKELEFVRFDHATASACVSTTDHIILGGSGSFSTELCQESVKRLVYTSERSELETDKSSPGYISLQENVADEPDQIPPAGYNKKATKDEIFSPGNAREYNLSTNKEIISTVSVLGSNYGESDKSPLLCGKLRAPILKLSKEQVPAPELAEEDDGIVLKKTVQELWQSPAKESVASSARGREKHKPRSSLFSSCMCCTTAISRR